MASIGRYAFNYCDKLQSVYVAAQTPPAMDFYYRVFDEIVLAEATLYVPEAYFDAYKTAVKWSDFQNISIFAPTSVEVVPVHQETDTPVVPVDYYNLSGRSIIRPESGIVLIRSSNGTTKKVMINE